MEMVYGLQRLWRYTLCLDCRKETGWNKANVTGKETLQHLQDTSLHLHRTHQYTYIGHINTPT